MLGKSILLIEDDAEEAELTQISFAEVLPDYSWRVVADGIEALNDLLSAEKPPPDLVILDLKLPRLGGLELLERLNAEWGPGLRDLKIAVLSSSYEDGDRLAAERLGARLYVRKPLSLAGAKDAARKIARIL